jgi:hypothetical protein
MSDIGHKIKEVVGSVDNQIKEVVGSVDSLTRFRKLTKAKASYIEYEKFTDSNLHEGYFCYNCIYWIPLGGGKCMLVENDGPDVRGNDSNVIAPHGCCSGYEPNYTKLHDTRQSAEGISIDPERNKEKITSKDLSKG